MLKFFEEFNLLKVTYFKSMPGYVLTSDIQDCIYT